VERFRKKVNKLPAAEEKLTSIFIKWRAEHIEHGQTGSGSCAHRPTVSAKVCSSPAKGADDVNAEAELAGTPDESKHKLVTRPRRTGVPTRTIPRRMPTSLRHMKFPRTLEAHLGQPPASFPASRAPELNPVKNFWQYRRSNLDFKTASSTPMTHHRCSVRGLADAPSSSHKRSPQSECCSGPHTVNHHDRSYDPWTAARHPPGGQRPGAAQGSRKDTSGRNDHCAACRFWK
jgi:hypothetical protein